MSRLPGVRLLLLAGLTAPLWLTSSARADCAAPEVLLPKKVSAGDEVRLEGNFWTDTCDDIGGSPAGGCFGSDDDGFDEGHPVQDISLVLVKPRGGRTELGTVDAGEDFSWELDVTIPDVEPGRYGLIAESPDGISSTTGLKVLP